MLDIMSERAYNENQKGKIMNERKVEVVEKAISKVLSRQTKLIIQPNGLPNKEWSRDVQALRILKSLSVSAHLD